MVNSAPTLSVNMYRALKVVVLVLPMEAVAPAVTGPKVAAAGPTELNGLMDALGLMLATPT